MTTVTTAVEPAAALRSQLDDPAVAEALSSLLEHADLLAILVVGLDGFLSRSELIGDEMASSFGELREMLDSPDATGVNPREVVSSLVKLSSALPTLSRMVDSGLLDSLVSSIAQPETVERLGVVTKGVADGLSAPPVQVGGPLSLLRQLKDPDVSRGLGFTLTLLKSIGSELNSHSGTA
ncbi:DUF1641 domain-containing protein [Aeromicrobium sp.]|uniref:DUF1641 domain-containing protein n=1 Tax=Aeromicrobium sp. TaxID=1871063 RepID=UPI0019C91CE3|nr:DUF1641 domain-containing protein [Aeromicrobium sp.]MBC7631847.1 DUF1641 domain-containing protein [Aeromicrobium sp.]